jgi:hypothetical protein
MKGGDFTRDTFDKTKHFSRVLMQQGRVQLDADWNEQAAIMLHYLRALAADVIGTHGGTSNSFLIEERLGSMTLSHDFAIHDGHYYVDGILCELEGKAVPISVQSTNKVHVSTWVVDDVEFREGQYVEVFDAAQPSALIPTPFKITEADLKARILTLGPGGPELTGEALRLRRITTYLTQSGYPVPDDMKLSADQKYLVYLDVWERHITYLEDDGNISIREVALGGPDTATRAKVVWQVKVLKSAASCDDVKKLDRLSLPTLRARAKQTELPNDPCLIQPDARYRGVENQLYRVEIHTGSQDTDGHQTPPTFKWSRENASVIFPILTITPDTTTTTVTLATLGRDDCLGLKTDDWVEIVDDTYTLQNRAEPLLQVSSVDRDTMTVSLTGTPKTSINVDPSSHPLLRRWDHQGKKDSDPKLYGQPLTLGTDKALKVVENDGENTEDWLTLEGNVQIQFPKPLTGQPPNQYRTGDYWLIPARTATGDVEWPSEKGTDGKVISSAMPPHGVEHHYAPLAVISVNNDGTVTAQPSCRLAFHPLNGIGS